MKQRDDDAPSLPIFHRAWEPAPPRERKPIPTRRPDREPPHLGTRKRRLAIVRGALEAMVTNDRTDPIERRGARKLLCDLNRIAKRRPDTTMLGMVPVGAGRICIWVFEPELAPVGRTPERNLKRNAALTKALHDLRSL